MNIPVFTPIEQIHYRSVYMKHSSVIMQLIQHYLIKNYRLSVDFGMINERKLHNDGLTSLWTLITSRLHGNLYFDFTKFSRMHLIKNKDTRFALI